MIPLTPGEIVQLREPQERSLDDMGVLLPRVVATDEANEPTETWPEAGAIEVDCGFDPTGGQERSETLTGRGALSAPTVIIDARIRVSLADADYFGPHDHFRLTHRQGEPLLLPQDFDCIGYPQYGVTVAHVLLRRVEV